MFDSIARLRVLLLLACVACGSGGSNAESEASDGGAQGSSRGEDGGPGEGASAIHLDPPQTVTVLSGVSGRCAENFDYELAPSVQLSVDGSSVSEDGEALGTGTVYLAAGQHDLELAYYLSGCRELIFADSLDVEKGTNYALLLQGARGAETVTVADLGALAGDGSDVLFANLSEDVPTATFALKGEKISLGTGEWKVGQVSPMEKVTVSGDGLDSPLEGTARGEAFMSSLGDTFIVPVCYLAPNQDMVQKLNCRITAIFGNADGWY